MCLISKVTGRNLISGKELQYSNIYNVVLPNKIIIIIIIIALLRFFRFYGTKLHR